MALRTGTVAPSCDASTLNLTELLEHVRREKNYVPRHRNPEPHPVLIMVVGLGSLLICVMFWSLLAALTVMTWL